MKDRKNRKRTLFIAGIQLAVLLAFYFGIWKHSLVIYGVLAIIGHAWFSMYSLGWVAAFAYPITYWISGLCDTPEQGNIWVYWSFSYWGLLILAIVIDLILRKKCGNRKAL